MIDLKSIINKRLGNYQITEKLGEGGMGIVFKATDLSLRREVAIKFLPEAMSSDEILVKRFVREARSSARLNHPNIVTVFGVGAYEETYYIAMEFVPGAPLDQVITEDGKFSPKRAANITLQVAEGLAAAHAEGIVHRDVKPQNMIIAKNDVVKIMDFGLASIKSEDTSLTTEGTTLGTADYMSPEQWMDSHVDARSDIFSLGITLFGMLTAQLPFAATTPYAVMRKTLDEPAPDARAFNDSIDDDLLRIMDLMLQKDRERRYPSADLLANDLRQYISGPDSSSTLEPFADPGSEVVRQNIDQQDADIRKASAVQAAASQSASVPTSDFVPLEAESRSTQTVLMGGLVVGTIFLFALGLYLFMFRTPYADLIPEDDFVFIKPGEFLMGSSPNEVGRGADETIHRVTLSSGFWMSRYEVTQAQWMAVMGTNPSGLKGDNLPIEQVSWEDVQTFIRKLSDESGIDYRLPTEAEWEYAARAGSTGNYSFGSNTQLLGDYAWYAANSGNQTHSVGTKLPNAWGLHDMAGNVWEWCQDWGGSYGNGSAVDPRGPKNGEMRIGRGGSWGVSESMCRSADRSASRPTDAGADLGFRLVHD